MNNSSFKPIKMLPYLKETVWGGSKLEKEFGKERGSLENIAESWELSAIPNQESYTVSDTFENHSFDTVYKHFNNQDECPVLVKFIDSESDLSIQVHPSVRSENALPKNECWYILSAEENSKIAYGLKENTAHEDIDKALSNGNLCNILNYVSVKPGDFFYVPAGMIHAIGKGITLLEIQQSSDTTYRLYDYDRVDSNGKKRELHIEKGKAEIINFSQDKISALRFSRKTQECLCSCDYFTVIKISERMPLPCDEIFKNSTVTFLSDGKIETPDTSINAKKGDTFYIPPQNSKTNTVICAEHAILTLF